MNIETAQGYVDRLGSVFFAMINDPNITAVKIAEKYKISGATICSVRHLIAGTTRRKVVRMLEITPEMVRLFTSKITNREIAERLGLTKNQVAHHRREYRPNTRIHSLRLDGPTVALLKSDLPVRDVARALNVGQVTVYRNRNSILNRQSGYKYRPLTAELLARVYACPDTQTATRVTGLCLFTTKALFLRRRILSGDEQARTRKSKHADRFPADPTWWQARTQKQIGHQLKVSPGTVWYHALTRGYTYKGMQKIGI